MDSLDKVQNFLLCSVDKQQSSFEISSIVSENKPSSEHLTCRIEDWLQTRAHLLTAEPTKDVEKDSPAMQITGVMDDIVNFLDTVNPQKEELRHHLRTQIAHKFLPLHYNHQKQLMDVTQCLSETWSKSQEYSLLTPNNVVSSLSQNLERFTAADKNIGSLQQLSLHTAADMEGIKKNIKLS